MICTFIRSRHRSITPIATSAACWVSGAIDLVARPNGVRNWMLIQRRPRSHASCVRCSSLSVLLLVSVTFMPSSTPRGANLVQLRMPPVVCSKASATPTCCACDCASGPCTLKSSVVSPERTSFFAYSG